MVHEEEEVRWCSTHNLMPFAVWNILCFAVCAVLCVLCGALAWQVDQLLLTFDIDAAGSIDQHEWRAALAEWGQVRPAGSVVQPSLSAGTCRTCRTC